MTVLGPILPAELGHTQIREHLICDAYWVSGYVDNLLNDERGAIEELAPYAAAGGRSLVEPTNIGLRRNPEALRRISQASGIHVVMGCGWYAQRYYPAQLERRSADDLAEEMVGDLTIGVDETGICAGIIGEIGLALDYISPAEERVLRAAARAHKRTGAAIYVSSDFHPLGLAQLDILVEEGADLRRVIVGHADTYLDLSYHTAIARRGANVAYDGVGKKHIYPDERRVATIKALVEAGYGGRILLACGTSRRSDLHAYGGPGYDHLLRCFLPMLQAADIAEEELHLFTIANPTRVLADWS